VIACQSCDSRRGAKPLPVFVAEFATDPAPVVHAFLRSTTAADKLSPRPIGHRRQAAADEFMTRQSLPGLTLAM